MIIKYTIELSWAHGGHTGKIEIEDEIGQLSETDRDAIIEERVGEAVANEVSWGWMVIS